MTSSRSKDCASPMELSLAATNFKDPPTWVAVEIAPAWEFKTPSSLVYLSFTAPSAVTSETSPAVPARPDALCARALCSDTSSARVKYTRLTTRRYTGAGAAFLTVSDRTLLTRGSSAQS